MCWMSIVLVLSLSGQAYTFNRACTLTKFQFNGDCLPCPDKCTSCISNTNCSTCKSNYYGPICQNECRTECNDTCHKEYGHCTYGCIDGTYSMPESGKCISCPINCLICSSARSCFACARGFFGATCQIRCPDACLDERCNQHNGECFECKEGYFSTSEGCRRCTDGCAGCNGTENCFACQYGFYGPIDGKCISKCQTEYRSRRFLAKRDDKCGSSIQPAIGDTEICPNIWGDRSYKCLTEKYCMNYTACTADHRCSFDGGDDAIDDVCVTVMSVECRTTCITPASPVHGSSWNHRCIQTCTIEVPKNTSLGSLCFHGNILVAVNDSTYDDSIHDTLVRCSEDVSKSGTSATVAESDVYKIVVIVQSVALLVLIVYAVARRRRVTSRRSRVCESRSGQNITPEVVVDNGEYDVIAMIPNHRQAGCSGNRYDHFSRNLQGHRGACGIAEQSGTTRPGTNGVIPGEEMQLTMIPASDERDSSNIELTDLTQTEWARQEYTD